MRQLKKYKAIQKIFMILAALILLNFAIPNCSMAARKELVDAVRQVNLGDGKLYFKDGSLEALRKNSDWTIEDWTFTEADIETIINHTKGNLDSDYTGFIETADSAGWDMDDVKYRYKNYPECVKKACEAWNSEMTKQDEAGGNLNDAVDDAKDAAEDAVDELVDSKLEGADKGAAGGVLFEPIAWLLQGIGDVSNQMIQRVLMGSWERVFFDTGFGNFNETKVKEVIGRNPTMGELENVDVVQDYIKGWTKHYGVPEIRITPAEIFAGNVAALDANFFEDDANVSNKLGGDEFSIVLQLKPVVAKWYVAIRNIAIVGLLSVLLYIGIRIIVSSSAGDKAKYKQLFTDWVVALCLIFFMHYIMSFTMTMSETVTDVLSGSNTQQGTIKQVNIRLTDTNGSPIGGLAFSSNFTGVARIKADYKDTALKMGYSILYLILTGYTVYFSFVYLKRLVMLAFFTMIAPLVALTYPIDKVKDGKAQAFNYWFKEYMFYALLQPMHMVLYTVLIGSALNIATTNLLYAIVAFACIVPAEKIVKQMFGIKGQTESAISGFAGGALATQAFNTIKSLGKGKTGPSNPAGNAANNGVRMTNDLNRPSAMNTLAANAMEQDSSTVTTAGAAALAGGAAGTALGKENSVLDQVYDEKADNPAIKSNLSQEDNDKIDELGARLIDGQMSQEQYEKKVAKINKRADNRAANKERIEAEKQKYEAGKKQLKNKAGNFGKAVQRRWFAAGGMKGVAKKAAKGYVKGTMAVTGMALGASMGAIGGDVNNLWQAGAAGLATGGFVGNRVNKAISNFGNSAVGRFAKEVAWGDDYINQENINRYKKDPANTQMIMQKHPDFDKDQIRVRRQEMAEMSSRTGITDFAVLDKAVDVKHETIAEEEEKIRNQNLSDNEKAERMKQIQNKAFEQTAAYAKLSQNISEDTLADPKKRENAINYRQKQLEGKGLSSNAARNEAERIIRMAEKFK